MVSLLSCSASQPLFSSRASFSKSSLSSGKTRFSYHSRTIHDNPANDTNYSQTLVTSLLTSSFTFCIYLATLVNHQVTLVDQQQANRMAGNPSRSLDTSRLDISKYLTDLLTYLPTDWGRCLRCFRRCVSISICSLKSIGKKLQLWAHLVASKLSEQRRPPTLFHGADP